MQIDNYERLIEQWREKAMGFDYKERYEALGLPGYNEGDLPIVSFGRLYEISRTDARVRDVAQPGRKLDYQTVLSIYHLFHFSVKWPVNSGRFVPFRDVKRCGPFAPAFKKQVLQPFAKAFEGKKELLIEAGGKLGFRRLPQSDAGFEAKAFECMPVQILFWDGDDEFSAQANILFDENITDFTHEETVVVIGDNAAKSLLSAAGLDYEH